MKEDLSVMELAEFNKAFSELYSFSEKNAIYAGVLEAEKKMFEITIGKDNSITRAIQWFIDLDKKYGPLVMALIVFFEEMKPILSDKGKLSLPKRFRIDKYVRIGLAAGKLLFVIIKLLINKGK